MLIAYEHKDIILRLFYLDSSKIILTIKKVSWVLVLGHNFLNIILFARKGVQVFLCQSHISLEISHYSSLFAVGKIIDNQYVICTIDYYSNNTFD